MNITPFYLASAQKDPLVLRLPGATLACAGFTLFSTLVSKLLTFIIVEFIGLLGIPLLTEPELLMGIAVGLMTGTEPKLLIGAVIGLMVRVPSLTPVLVIVGLMLIVLMI